MKVQSLCILEIIAIGPRVCAPLAKKVGFVPSLRKCKYHNHMTSIKRTDLFSIHPTGVASINRQSEESIAVTVDREAPSDSKMTKAHCLIRSDCMAYGLPINGLSTHKYGECTIVVASLEFCELEWRERRRRTSKPRCGSHLEQMYQWHDYYRTHF